MEGLSDYATILHPAIAVFYVFPLIGISVYFALQTRQRRLQAASGKSKIPPSVGLEHVKIGKLLSGSVVIIGLIALASDSVKYIISNQLWSKDTKQVILLTLMFVATIAALGFLYYAKQALWRGVFATLTGLGFVLIGFQDKVFNRQDYGAIFRRDDQWYVSHFYYGTLAVLLMIFSLAIVQEIYQDRKNRWRTVHIVLNTIAVLIFIGQGITGTRDLLEIPLSWQEPYIYSCDFVKMTCPTPNK
jgi:hypothetical protein